MVKRRSMSSFSVSENDAMLLRVIPEPGFNIKDLAIQMNLVLQKGAAEVSRLAGSTPPLPWGIQQQQLVSFDGTSVYVIAILLGLPALQAVAKFSSALCEELGKETARVIKQIIETKLGNRNANTNKPAQVYIDVNVMDSATNCRSTLPVLINVGPNEATIELSEFVERILLLLSDDKVIGSVFYDPNRYVVCFDNRLRTLQVLEKKTIGGFAARASYDSNTSSKSEVQGGQR